MGTRRPQLDDYREYSVRIEPHGRTLRVSADRPVLEAALAPASTCPTAASRVTAPPAGPG